mgnify:CR=1 FL=1
MPYNEHFPREGRIEVICGGMFSGKTEELIRRIKRDITERGRDVEEVLNRYQNTLKPMHMQFIEPMKEFADIIIPNNRYNTVAIDIIKTIVHNRVYQKWKERL